MEAYLFKFTRKAILCIRSDGKEFTKISELLNSKYGGYNYGFSSTSRTRNDNGTCYTSLEILDRGSDNINCLKDKVKKSFNVDINIEARENFNGDLRKLLDFCIDKFVEKHK